MLFFGTLNGFCLWGFGARIPPLVQVKIDSYDNVVTIDSTVNRPRLGGGMGVNKKMTKWSDIWLQK